MTKEAVAIELTKMYVQIVKEKAFLKINDEKKLTGVYKKFLAELSDTKAS